MVAGGVKQRNDEKSKSMLASPGVISATLNEGIAAGCYQWRSGIGGVSVAPHHAKAKSGEISGREASAGQRRWRR